MLGTSANQTVDQMRNGHFQEIISVSAFVKLTEAYCLGKGGVPIPGYGHKNTCQTVLLVPDDLLADEKFHQVVNAYCADPKRNQLPLRDPIYQDPDAAVTCVHYTVTAQEIVQAESTEYYPVSIHHAAFVETKNVLAEANAKALVIDVRCKNSFYTGMSDREIAEMNKLII